MKIFFAGIALLIFGIANSQTTAYSGIHDLKAELGLDLQRYNSLGAAAVVDYGLGKVFSVGLQASYLFKVKDIDGYPPTSYERFDAKARVNASLGRVFRLPDTMDFYPGLDLGLRNFGGHLGLRYYLDNGIGLFTEGQFVIQKYTSSIERFNALNNQFAFLVGLTFDLHHEAN